MRKVFIFAIVILLSVNSFAQRTRATYARPVSSVDGSKHLTARTTAIGDTLVLSNINPTDTLTIYRTNISDSSGYVTGTNIWNDQGFAERYDINGSDSTVQVLGVLAEFSGKVNPASTKDVTFTLWSQSIPDVISSTLSYNGFPESILDSVSVPVTRIGIGTNTDTLKEYLFSTPALETTSFFVGYSIIYNYSALGGDTLGLVCSKNGQRIGDDYIASVHVTDFGDTLLDTVMNVQNATLGADFNWYDNYTQNDSLFNNLAIFPIVVIQSPSGVKGVTRNSLTYFGNYPNPAINSTNIKFTLATAADVTIQTMDMSGRVLNSIKQPGLASGTHIVPVNTSEMPSGDYLFMIRTSAGDGIAGKMTVIH